MVGEDGADVALREGADMARGLTTEDTPGPVHDVVSQKSSHMPAARL